MLEMQKTMRGVSQKELGSIYATFFTLGQQLRHLPSAHLRRADRHQFGAIKHWVKWKSAKNPPGNWSEVKYRPLRPYTAHHWERVLSLAGKYCVWVLDYL